MEQISEYSLVDETFSEEAIEKYRKQHEERGFDDTELWNFDATICKFVLPRLKVFKDIHMGYPGEVGSEEEWIKILNKIIYAMEKHLEDIHFDINEERKIQEGFELFGKYLINLWD